MLDKVKSSGVTQSKIFKSLLGSKGLRKLFLLPFNPKGSPFDEENLLALDRVKSSGVRQSKIYKSLLGRKGLKNIYRNFLRLQ